MDRRRSSGAASLLKIVNPGLYAGGVDVIHPMVSGCLYTATVPYDIAPLDREI